MYVWYFMKMSVSHFKQCSQIQRPKLAKAIYLQLHIYMIFIGKILIILLSRLHVWNVSIEVIVKPILLNYVPVVQWYSNALAEQKVVGSIPREHTDKKCIAWMHYKSLWIKESAKWINVNDNESLKINVILLNWLPKMHIKKCN